MVFCQNPSLSLHSLHFPQVSRRAEILVQAWHAEAWKTQDSTCTTSTSQSLPRPIPFWGRRNRSRVSSIGSHIKPGCCRIRACPRNLHVSGLRIMENHVTYRGSCRSLDCPRKIHLKIMNSYAFLPNTAIWTCSRGLDVRYLLSRTTCLHLALSLRFYWNDFEMNKMQSYNIWLCLCRIKRRWCKKNRQERFA